jgi:hypothetical protein
MRYRLICFEFCSAPREKAMNAIKMLHKNLWLSLLLSAATLAPAGAATIYKCVKAGKITYTSSPPAGDSDCQAEQLKVVEPSPEEVARQLEENRRREEQAALDEANQRREREVRAQERAAIAAEQRARIAEENLRLQWEEAYRLKQLARRSYAPTYLYPLYNGGFGNSGYGGGPPYPYPYTPANPPPFANPASNPPPAPPPPTGAVRKR